MPKITDGATTLRKGSVYSHRRCALLWTTTSILKRLLAFLTPGIAAQANELLVLRSGGVWMFPILALEGPFSLHARSANERIPRFSTSVST